MNITAESTWNLLRNIHQNKPLVHCITNMVTVNECANILLAAGASPTMAHHPMEVVEVTGGCKSLVCNLGATEYMDSMLLAAGNAEEYHHPLVIDPVGVSGSSFRRNFCYKLIDRARPSCIRGNMSEIMALIRDENTVTGVDAGMDVPAGANIDEIHDFAVRHNTVVIASGAVDYVVSPDVAYKVENGSSFMTRITGSGCMSSALLGAFLCEENSPMGCAICCAVMGICGEIAEDKTRKLNGGTMTFRDMLIDSVSLLTKEQIEERMKIKFC